VRRYGEVVEVLPGDDLRPEGEREGPAQFLWRDRLYVVRAVLGSWAESRAWWRSLGPQRGVQAADLEVWRVEAARGRRFPAVVVDLALDPHDGRWRLLRTHD
jgi:hypothetical protein